MSVIARVVRSVSKREFAIYCDDVLVANVTTVDGLDEALAATREAGFDPSTYVPGLHVAGMATAAATQWFVAWRGSGGKRDLAIRDHDREQTILVFGAFISAWSEGSWYDLVIAAAVIDQ